MFPQQARGCVIEPAKRRRTPPDPVFGKVVSDHRCAAVVAFLVLRIEKITEFAPQLFRAPVLQTCLLGKTPDRLIVEACVHIIGQTHKGVGRKVEGNIAQRTAAGVPRRKLVEHAENFPLHRRMQNIVSGVPFSRRPLAFHPQQIIGISAGVARLFDRIPDFRFQNRQGRVKRKEGCQREMFPFKDPQKVIGGIFPDRIVPLGQEYPGIELGVRPQDRAGIKGTAVGHHRKEEGIPATDFQVAGKAFRPLLKGAPIACADNPGCCGSVFGKELIAESRPCHHRGHCAALCVIGRDTRRKPVFGAVDADTPVNRRHLCITVDKENRRRRGFRPKENGPAQNAVRNLVGKGVFSDNQAGIERAGEKPARNRGFQNTHAEFLGNVRKVFDLQNVRFPRLFDRDGVRFPGRVGSVAARKEFHEGSVARVPRIKRNKMSAAKRLLPEGIPSAPIGHPRKGFHRGLQLPPLPHFQEVEVRLFFFRIGIFRRGGGFRFGTARKDLPPGGVCGVDRIEEPVAHIERVPRSRSRAERSIFRRVV